MHIYELSYQSDFSLCECMATQCTARRHRRWMSLSAALGAGSRSLGLLMHGLPDKKLKYYNVNVNYKNIRDYILFLFIMLTSSI